MQITRTFLMAGSSLALLAAPALAQARRLPVQTPPPRSAVGTQTSPPARQSRNPDRAESRDREGGGYYPRSRASSYAPSFVGQDGQVYANFGYGYERVVRQCTSDVVQQPTVRQPVPQAYSQPEVTQPVPRPQTTSPGTLAQQPGYSGLTPGSTGTMHAGAPTQFAQAACWSRLANGNVTVQR